jgi:small nuclear ribonucleoprotein (snRNP)-like protein
MNKTSSNSILVQNLDKVIEVRLGVGKSVSGKLKWFDEHLNLLLEVSDMKKTSFVMVRGSNVVLLSGLDFRSE